ncbi:sensor histidine kinase [Aggregatilinea lenta]|uniref:sensor histidine kinase n=1 Tax=Aggregatilinea lenta TaxID=913108 RepID=UPI0013C29F78|nr:GAF domain-containing protein [Aggregatilinea lenta]
MSLQKKVRDLFSQPEFYFTRKGYILGEVVGVEITLAQIRRVGVVAYLVWLMFATSNPLWVSKLSLVAFTGLLIIVQIVFGYLEKNHDRYQLQPFRILRFHYYLAVATFLLVLGRGAGEFLFLYLPYLTFAGIYFGLGWSIVGTFEATSAVYLVLKYLDNHGILAADHNIITLATTGMLSAGIISTLCWYYYIPKIQHEVRALRTALGLASLDPTKNLTDSTVYGAMFDRLSKFINIDSALIVADIDGDGVFEVVGDHGYAEHPEFEFVIGGRKSKEGLTGTVLTSKKTLLLSDVAQSKTKPKYQNIAKNRRLESYLGVPLLLEDNLVGAIVLTSDKKGAIGQEEKLLLEAISPWLAVLVQSAIAHRHSRLANNYLQEIFDLSDEGIIVSDLHGHIILYNVHATNILEFPQGTMSRITLGDIFVDPEKELSKLVTDTVKSANIFNNHLADMQNSRSERRQVTLSSSRLKGPDGRPQVVLFFKAVRDLPLGDKRIQALIEVSKLASTRPFDDMDDQAHRILQFLSIGLEDAHFAVLRLKQDQILQIRSWSATLDGEGFEHLDLGLGEGLTGISLGSGEPIQVLDVQQDYHFRFPDFAKKYNLRAALIVPLNYGDHPLGTLAVYRYQPKLFSEAEHDFILLFSELASIVIATSNLVAPGVKKHSQSLLTDYTNALTREIWSPLSTIRGWTQLLQAAVEPKLKDKVAQIGEATEEINRVLLESLEFRKELPIRKRSGIELAELIIDAIERTKKEVTEIPDIYDFQVDIPNLRVEADPVLFGSAIFNIVSNAVEFQPDGGTISIKSTMPKANKVNLIISDTGPGISTRHFPEIDRIFLPNFSTKSHAEQQGYSRSLAYAERIVEAHGWSILARNLLDQGAEFCIYGIDTAVD